VVVCARLDPTLALRLVDVGPAADDTKAALRFRAFWGAKSELRRFVDGTICEAVVWDASPADRHTVPDAAVSTALTLHGPPGTSVAGCSGALDSLLLQGAPGGPPLEQPAGGGRPEGALDANASVTSFRLMEAAADKLSKQLRAVEDGALKVVGVQPISAFSRQTCAFFPLPHELAGGQSAPSSQRLARCVEPVELLVQLESSGKWPDDPSAFAKVKAALSVQLAAALEAGCGLTAVCSEECVDVLVDGFAFRLLFHSTRDEAVLARQAEEEAAGTAVAGASPLTGRPSPLVASWHHGLVSLVAGANPAYAPSARLASRWLSSQMLGNHFAPEAVELLVAAAFCGASSLPQPGSRVAGFLRFLELLSTHPWASRPLVVDPEHAVTKVQRAAIMKAFDAARRGGAHAQALHIATPRDPGSRQWTLHRPSTDALAHAAAAAAKALRSLRSLIERGGSGGGDSTLAPPYGAWAAPFAPPLDSFDAVLMLRPDARPHCARALPGGAHTASRRASKRAPDVISGADDAASGPPPKRARAFLRAFPEAASKGRNTKALIPELLVGFDPVARLLEALTERFGHLADFCSDPDGGLAIGVRWRGAAFLPGAPRAAGAHTSLPCARTTRGGGGALCVPNVIQVRVRVRARASEGRRGWISAALATPHLLQPQGRWHVPSTQLSSAYRCTPQVLTEMRALGEGMVDDIVAVPGCRRM
jgi:U3 small nucleolar RNA-associated protein 22